MNLNLLYTGQFLGLVAPGVELIMEPLSDSDINKKAVVPHPAMAPPRHGTRGSFSPESFQGGTPPTF